MCGTCGCSKSTNKLAPAPHPVATLSLEERILARNDAVASRNRAWLASHGAVALNLMSSPGAGKTRLLERTVREYPGPLPLRVIDGDQATSHDADRIRAAGGDAIQINTGASCHLNAEAVRAVIEDQEAPALVLIENVGNLVCPSLFDLGESHKIVIASVTEGDDKPAKYPHMHRVADLVVLNKIDLLEHVDFSRDRFLDFLRQVNPDVNVIEVSAKTGVGLTTWYAWLAQASLAASSTSATASHGHE